MDSEKAYQLIMLHIHLQILFLKHGTRKCIFLVFFVTWQKCLTVNHDILLFKLNYRAIQGEILDWFTSHLYSREQRVDIKSLET
jgi:hypothetical protein